jgi:hypothetical protein
MKRKLFSLGHVEVAYGLSNVFVRAVKEFEEADAAKLKIDAEYERSKAAELMPRTFDAMAQRNEAGVVLLMSAVAVLEDAINQYAYTFLDPDSFEEHLGNLRLLTKWLLLPRLCQNKEIPEGHPAINSMRELIKARNAIVHHKRKDMLPNFKRAQEKTTTEVDRFLAASRNAKHTVEELVKLLTDSTVKYSSQQLETARKYINSLLIAWEGSFYPTQFTGDDWLQHRFDAKTVQGLYDDLIADFRLKDGNKPPRWDSEKNEPVSS